MDFAADRLQRQRGYFDLLRDKKKWIASRKRKALKIIKLLNEETGTLKDKMVLDLGCSLWGSIQIKKIRDMG